MPKTTQAAIEEFLASAKEPVAIEPGEEPYELVSGWFALELRAHGVTLQVWDEHRNLVRVVTGVRKQDAGRLELEVRRFGSKSGAILLVDRRRASNHAVGKRAGRDVFRERFRRMVERNFPGWNLANVSAEADLEHTLPGGFGRGFVHRGAAGWAVLGVPHDVHAANAALTYGLIWLDHLRRRERKVLVQGLVLFLPVGMETVTCLRIRCLNRRAARFTIFVYGTDNWEEQIDLNAHGNLDTVLKPAGAEPPVRAASIALPPEAELERLLRRQISVLDARLREEPVYGQVPALAGLDRGIMDLLAVTHGGRLCVIELKASQDQHLPIQALDYWMRVKWHNERGEFPALGYFPGIPLRAEAPRLMLVAPSLEFHPSTETLLRFYSEEIEVERAGLGVEWQKEIAVRFRLTGAQTPL